MATPAPFLRTLPLFSRLSASACAELEHHVKYREFAPQSVIVREGGPGDAAFFIVSGLVAVRRREPESGVELLLAELGSGQMFGEMALLTGKPRNATVVAIEATACARRPPARDRVRAAVALADRSARPHARPAGGNF